MSEDYLRDCVNCGDIIEMRRIHNRWKAYELDSESKHICGYSSDGKKRKINLEKKDFNAG